MTRMVLGLFIGLLSAVLAPVATWASDVVPPHSGTSPPVVTSVLVVPPSVHAMEAIGLCPKVLDHSKLLEPCAIAIGSVKNAFSPGGTGKSPPTEMQAANSVNCNRASNNPWEALLSSVQLVFETGIDNDFDVALVVSS